MTLPLPLGCNLHRVIALRTRTILLAGIVATVAAAALPVTARADFKLGVDEPRAIANGGANPHWISKLRSTNSSLYRFMINWRTTAPTRPTQGDNPNDPAYDWRETDSAVRFAKSIGAEVLLSVFCAPTWAQGPNPPASASGARCYQEDARTTGSWKPNIAEFGKFGTAIAKRYDGTTRDPLGSVSTLLPRASLFEAWNEPNYKMYLSPQCTKGEMTYGNVCTKGGSLSATTYYRSMLNAFYAGVKAIQPQATVSTAGLGPYGNSSQGYEIDPQSFLRPVLCLGGTPTALRALSATTCPRPSLDAIAIHPYTSLAGGSPTAKAGSVNGGALGNLPDFRRMIDFATVNGTVLPALPRGSAKELWATEWGWFTCPPCRASTSPSKPLGFTPEIAARYTAETVYRSWAAGVQKSAWFWTVDEPGWPGGLFFKCAAAATERYAQCAGATIADAVAKPALSAFRFPVFAAKASSTTAFAWAMSPCKVPGSTLRFEVLNSKTKAWSAVNVPGPIDPKTKKPTSIPLVLTLPAGTDGTIKSSAWTIPTSTTSIRATASGTGCSTETSVAMPIASK